MTYDMEFFRTNRRLVILAGVLPAATALDQPLPPKQVEALVASTHFIVAAPRMGAHSQPRMTG